MNHIRHAALQKKLDFLDEPSAGKSAARGAPIFPFKRPQFFRMLSDVSQNELTFLPATPGLLESIAHVGE
jgi:hypothetical protein